MPDNVELVYLQCESFEEVEQVLNYTLTPQQRCDSWVVQGDDNDWTIFYPRAITPAPKPINVEESAILREVRDIINNLPDKER